MAEVHSHFQVSIALLIIGAGLIWAGVKGNAGALGELVVGEFKTGFLYWALAILVIGAVGAVPVLRTLSNWFLVLLILALVLNNKSLVANAEAAIGLKKG